MPYFFLLFIQLIISNITFGAINITIYNIQTQRFRRISSPPIVCNKKLLQVKNTRLLKLGVFVSANEYLIVYKMIKIFLLKILI